VLGTSIVAGASISAGYNSIVPGAIAWSAYGLTPAIIGALVVGAVFCIPFKMPRLRDDLKQCAELTVVAGYCQGFQILFHNQMCGLMFRCNCVWNWQGGWVDCNVHNKTGPKCPWCIARASLSWTTDSLVLGLMILAYEAARSFSFCNRESTSPRAVLLWQLTLPVLVFFGAGLLVAAIFYAFSADYPWFLSGPQHGRVPDDGVRPPGA
jgi:hypothetical protein